MERILVVEDDLALSAGLCFELDSAGYTVVAAYNCNKAVSLVSQEAFSLVVLDVNLPDGSGFEFAQDTAAPYEIPFIFLTAHNLEDEIIGGYHMGAEDYITKPFSMVLLGKRVLALLRRGGKIEEKDIWRCGNISVDFNGYLAERNGEPIELAPKEIQLFKLLIENTGRVMTREKLIDGVWGIDAPLYDRTIDTHIRRIRQKLDLNCITTVKGVGYRFEVSP